MVCVGVRRASAASGRPGWQRGLCRPGRFPLLHRRNATDGVHHGQQIREVAALNNLPVFQLEYCDVGYVDALAAGRDTKEGPSCAPAGRVCAVRLARLLRTCAEDDGRFEIGVRAWAAEDVDARRAAAKVDRMRTEYLAELLIAASIPPDEATRRARIGYVAWLGTYIDATPGTIEDRRNDMASLSRLLLMKTDGT